MAETITVISSKATQQILAELAASYGKTGRTVHVESVGGVDAARRIRAGEVFDIVVLASDALQALVVEGHVVRDSVHAFAHSPTAVAVPAGAPLPERSDEAAIRTLVSGAKRVGLSTGPSGKSVALMLQNWGALTSTQCRIVQALPGEPVARLLARGEADVGFQQLSEMLGEPGIEIVGTVPTSLQPMTVFSCGIGRATTNVASAQDLMSAFLSDDAATAKRRGGMEPGLEVGAGGGR
jgi:molybdate transport system substrate-binding protein